ncbi:MAG: ABC transporter substrate-binding protein [Holosporaceae bacterium]|jgi:putative ABC transport system substrate-binding protein|nr:ABC transporter substrate-binding protein [Holosporaceae bacterium]
MKKNALLLLIIIIIASLYLALSKKNSNSIKINVCKVIEHEALNSVVAGMDDYLRKQNKNYKISVETCQGNMALASQIIAKFANSGSDIVVTVGTTPSQCAFKMAKDGKIKLIFSSVTNPNDISEKLSGNNTTGVSNFVDLEPQIELFRRIQPALKTLGIIYNTGEANSVSIINKLRKVCENMGIKLEEQGISRSSDVYQATDKLAKIVDAVFITNDNLALTGIPTIVGICNRNKIPVYVSDTDQVANGCLASFGPNQYNIGVQTGEIIKKIVDGEDINSMAVAYPKVNELYLNLKAAKILGIEIPQNLRDQAKKIIE